MGMFGKKKKEQNTSNPLLQEQALQRKNPAEKLIAKAPEAAREAAWAPPLQRHIKPDDGTEFVTIRVRILNGDSEHDFNAKFPSGPLQSYRICKIIATKESLPANAAHLFTLWIVAKDLELQLRPDVDIFSIMDQWNTLVLDYTHYPEAVDPSHPINRHWFVYRREASVTINHERHFTDDATVRLLYGEAKRNVMTGRYVCTLSDGVALGGMILAIASGQYDRIKHPNGYITKNDLWKTMIPKRLHDELKPEEWEGCLQAEHNKHSGKTTEKLRIMFLELVREWACYGCSFFPCCREKPPAGFFEFRLQRWLLGVSTAGIVVMDLDKNGYAFAQQWDGLTVKRTPDRIVLRWTDKESGKLMKMKLFTPQAFMVSNLALRSKYMALKEEAGDNEPLAVVLPVTKINPHLRGVSETAASSARRTEVVGSLSPESLRTPGAVRADVGPDGHARRYSEGPQQQHRVDHRISYDPYQMPSQQPALTPPLQYMVGPPQPFMPGQESAGQQEPYLAGSSQQYPAGPLPHMVPGHPGQFMPSPPQQIMPGADQQLGPPGQFRQPMQYGPGPPQMQQQGPPAAGPPGNRTRSTSNARNFEMPPVYEESFKHRPASATIDVVRMASGYGGPHVPHPPNGPHPSNRHTMGGMPSPIQPPQFVPDNRSSYNGRSGLPTQEALISEPSAPAFDQLRRGDSMQGSPRLGASTRIAEQVPAGPARQMERGREPEATRYSVEPISELSNEQSYRDQGSPRTYGNQSARSTVRSRASSAVRPPNDLAGTYPASDPRSPDYVPPARNVPVTATPPATALNSISLSRRSSKALSTFAKSPSFNPSTQPSLATFTRSASFQARMALTQMTEPALPRQAPADFDKPQKSLEEQLAELEDLQIPSMDLDESASPRNGSTLAYGLVSSTSFAPMPRSTSSASYSQSPLLVADPEGSYYAPPVAHPINESSVPPNSNAIRPSMRSRSNSSYRAASDGYDPSQVNEALQGYERPSVTATRSSRRSSIVATISNAFKGSGEQGGAIKRGADQGTDWAAGSYAAY